VKGVCLLPADHRLASRKTIRARDLEGERFIATARQNGSRESVDAVFLDGKVNRKVDIEAENASTICHMVRRGLGVSVLSAVIAREFNADGLVARPFHPPVYFPITLLRSSLRPRSVIIATFIDCLKEELRFVLGAETGCTSES
jgi:DNA-binding transcriptional LysR family regulator